VMENVLLSCTFCDCTFSSKNVADTSQACPCCQYKTLRTRSYSGSKINIPLKQEQPIKSVQLPPATVQVSQFEATFQPSPQKQEAVQKTTTKPVQQPTQPAQHFQSTQPTFEDFPDFQVDFSKANMSANEPPKPATPKQEHSSFAGLKKTTSDDKEKVSSKGEHELKKQYPLIKKKSHPKENMN